MAHFCVGKGLQGGTPEESEARSRRIGENASNREWTTKILAEKVKRRRYTVNGAQRESASTITSSSWFPSGSGVWT